MFTKNNPFLDSTSISLKKSLFFVIISILNIVIAYFISLIIKSFPPKKTKSTSTKDVLFHNYTKNKKDKSTNFVHTH